MEKDIVAICPRCGGRAKVMSFRYDWNRDEEMAQLKCRCGRSEVPYLESRVLDVDLRNPYMKEQHFRVLIPEHMDEQTWSKISKCLTASWNSY